MAESKRVYVSTQISEDVALWFRKQFGSTHKGVNCALMAFPSIYEPFLVSVQNLFTAKERLLLFTFGRDAKIPSAPLENWPDILKAWALEMVTSGVDLNIENPQKFLKKVENLTLGQVIILIFYLVEFHRGVK